MKNAEKIFGAVEAMSGEIVSALQDLIRTPTVNPPGENYEEFVEHFGGMLAALGYETEVLRVPKERLNGHYDVVPAGMDWEYDPFGGEIVDSKLYGRGASDMKSGLVCQVYAVEALRRAGLEFAGEVTQSAVPDEETVGNMNAGMGYLVEQGVVSRENTDAVIITEPFGPEGVGIGHKGAIWGEITVHGEKAHGSSPLLGTNAIELAAAFIHRVSSDFQPKLAARTTDLGVTPEESIHSTLSFDTIRGGVATNIVPDRCVMTFNRRLLPGEGVADAREELFSHLEAHKKEDPSFHYEYRETYATEATLVSSSEPLVVVAKRAVEEFGLAPRELISAGSDDQRFVVHDAGISNSIIYGPGRTRLAHVTDEHITVEDLISATKILAMILHEYMASSGRDR